MRVLLLLLALCPVPSAQAAPRELLAAQSAISFSVSQMGVAVSGRFTRFSASINLDADQPEASSARVVVDIASLTTGDGEIDAVALDRPWLNQPAFTQALFESRAVRRIDARRYEADGTLTIRGRERAASVPFTVEDVASGRVRVRGELRIRRTDFGIGGGEWNAGELVANEVPVRFDLLLAPVR